MKMFLWNRYEIKSPAICYTNILKKVRSHQIVNAIPDKNNVAKNGDIFLRDLKTNVILGLYLVWQLPEL